ncbi:MAG: hypothetical protein A2148_07995 [Chloroflexi bacterium RBG_16_68_14]|nr:MAG: hypothetical protein A2148_07995 [Chloroflexi bacterium RBG_16_68_14]
MPAPRGRRLKIIGLSDTRTERPLSSSSRRAPRSFWITPGSRSGSIVAWPTASFSQHRPSAMSSPSALSSRA